MVGERNIWEHAGIWKSEGRRWRYSRGRQRGMRLSVVREAARKARTKRHKEEKIIKGQENEKEKRRKRQNKFGEWWRHSLLSLLYVLAFRRKTNKNSTCRDRVPINKKRWSGCASLYFFFSFISCFHLFLFSFFALKGERRKRNMPKKNCVASFVLLRSERDSGWALPLPSHS